MMTSDQPPNQGESQQSKPWVPWTGIALGVVLSLIPFMGWTQSGERVRNSFETFRAAQTLGLDQLTPLRVLWFVIPILPAIAAALLVAGKIRWSGVVVFLHAVIVLAAGMIVLTSGLSGGSGALTAAMAGIVTCGYAVWMVRMG